MRLSFSCGAQWPFLTFGYGGVSRSIARGLYLTSVLLGNSPWFSGPSSLRVGHTLSETVRCRTRGWRVGRPTGLTGDNHDYTEGGPAATPSAPSSAKAGHHSGPSRAGIGGSPLTVSRESQESSQATRLRRATVALQANSVGECCGLRGPGIGGT